MSGYEDWLDSLPSEVAQRQRSYDRRMRWLRMSAAGMTHVRIAEIYGLSTPRVWQEIRKARRQLVALAKFGRPIAPAEIWCQDCGKQYGSLTKKEWHQMKRAVLPEPVYQGPPIVWGSVDS